MHVKYTDVEAITDTFTSFSSEKKLDYRKFVGQSYDEAGTFQ